MYLHNVLLPFSVYVYFLVFRVCFDSLASFFSRRNFARPAASWRADYLECFPRGKGLGFQRFGAFLNPDPFSLTILTYFFDLLYKCKPTRPIGQLLNLHCRPLFLSAPSSASLNRSLHLGHFVLESKFNHSKIFCSICSPREKNLCYSHNNNVSSVEFLHTSG